MYMLLILILLSCLSGAGIYTNNTILSTFPLLELETNNIIFLDTLPMPEKKETVSVDYKKIIVTLIHAGDELLINELAALLDIPADETNKADAVLKKIVGEKDIRIFRKEALIKQERLGNIVLQNADQMKYLTVEKDEKQEKMIHINGNIIVYFQGSKITCSSLYINLDDNEIYGEGNVTVANASIYIVCDKFILNTKTKGGYLFNGEGKLNNVYYISELFKLNKNKTYIVEDTKIFLLPSLFTVEDWKAKAGYTGDVRLSAFYSPHFHLNASKVYVLNKDRFFAYNIGYFIHDHPFFWFPIYMKEPISSGLYSKFGHRTREGYFVQSKYSFSLLGRERLQFLFDLYQRMGAVIGLRNHYQDKAQRVDFDIRGARYLELKHFSLGTGLDADRIYTTYYNPELEQKVSYRYKIDYEHLLDLSSSQHRRTTLRWHVKQASDPYFKSDFERDFQTFDLMKSMRSILQEQPEYYYVRSAEPLEHYTVDFQEAGAGSSLRIFSAWDFRNYKNFNYPETDPRYWETRLSSIVLPQINYSKNGVFDPQEKSSGRGHLNIAYGLGLSYRYRELYKDREPYDYEIGINDFDVKTGISRGFDTLRLFDPNTFTVFNMIFSPSLRAGYRKKWGGEEKGIVQVQANQRETYLYVENSESLFFYFPNRKVQSDWSRSYSFVSMLPTANMGFSYNIKLRSVNEMENYAYDYLIDKQNVGYSINLQQKGYGLFYIYYLDIENKYSFNFAYDLKPAIDTFTGRYEKMEFEKERLSGMAGTLENYLHYKNNFHVRNRLSMSFLDTIRKLTDETTATYVNVKVFTNKLIKNNVSVTYSYNKFKKNRVFYLKNINTSFSWAYNFPEELYLNDVMRFGFVVKFNLLKFTDIDFSINSANTKSWMYFNKNPLYTGERPDFFTDIYRSINIFSREDREKGNFKFSSITASLYHDLDQWYLRANFRIDPRPLPPGTGAVKGYYYDMFFSFEINLKNFPQFSFPRQEFDLKPTLIKNWLE
ncbi:hypothetical protein ACFL6D_00455 [Spirochaetota bacterium]